MAKKVIYTAMIIIITIIGINISYYKTYAASAGIGGIVNQTIKSPSVNPDYYKPDSSDTAQGAEKVAEIGNTIIGTIQILGSILAVIVLVALGIKYMMGSVEEKAEYKKTMMPYVIGAIMVFGITNILSIIVSIASNLF